MPPMVYDPPKLRKAREDAGVSQHCLSGLAGLSLNSIIRAERGLVSPRMDTLCAIVGALGLAPNDVCSPVEPPKAKARTRAKRRGAG